MTQRRIDNLENLGEPAIPEAHQGILPATGAKPPPVPADINLNYPEPTLLSHILKDVSRWADLSFVMEPSVNAKLQIFAPHRLRRAEAWDLFLASLSVVNLRAVQSGKVVKIVPVSGAISA